MELEDLRLVVSDLGQKGVLQVLTDAHGIWIFARHPEEVEGKQINPLSTIIPSIQGASSVH